MKNILITGGSGLVGNTLTQWLLDRNYSVRWLSRKTIPNAPVPVFYWNIQKKIITPQAFDNVECIIHLAGAGIAAHRWTNSYRKTLADSRIESCRLLREKVAEYHVPLQAFISASATGIYGQQTSEHIFTENDAPANDFLGKLCQQWETEASLFSSKLGIRHVSLRTGVVLSKKGGALEKLIFPVKYGFGAMLGSGKQYMPWVHINDLCRIYTKVIEDENMRGAFNATAPQHLTNRQTMLFLAQKFHRKLWLPAVPAPLLSAMLGERASLLLKGSRVFPERLRKENDFCFQFPNFPKALSSLA